MLYSTDEYRIVCLVVLKCKPSAPQLAKLIVFEMARLQNSDSLLIDMFIFQISISSGIKKPKYLEACIEQSREDREQKKNYDWS